MPTRRELPRVFEPGDDEEMQDTSSDVALIAHGEYRPRDEYDAIMRAAIHEEPVVSRAERLELRDTIVDAIDSLDPLEQLIFNATIIERLPLRQLGDELNIPKTTLARRRDEVIEKLKQKLVNEPKILEYLGEK